MGTEPEMIERSPCLSRGSRVHELEELFLQEPCPCKVFGVGKYDLDGSPVVYVQPVGPCQQAVDDLVSFPFSSYPNE